MTISSQRVNKKETHTEEKIRNLLFDIGEDMDRLVARGASYRFVLLSLLGNNLTLRPDFTSQLELRLTSSCFILS